MRRNVLVILGIGLLGLFLFLPSGVIGQEKDVPGLVKELRGFRLFDTRTLAQMPNPNKDKFYRAEIVTHKMNAWYLNGIFCILPPPSTGAKVAYHYHRERESVLFIISGTGVEVVDGVRVPIKAGDVLFILPNVNHTIENTSDNEIRYVEFFTHPPVTADFVEVK